MRCVYRQSINMLVLIGLLVGPAFAGDNDPLFVDLTTDDAHRVNMAISFGKNQLDRGHPLTVFLNDRGVLVGSTAQASTFSDQQKQLVEIMGKGATIIVCPFCMKHYSI